MLRFRCSGDVSKRDAAPPPPGTGQTSPNPGIATYGLPRPTSQTTSSKPRNRYIRPPRPPPRPTSQTSSKPRNRYIRPPRPTSQTSPDLLPDPLPKTSSKPKNRYLRPPRPTPDLQTQESLQNPPPRPPQTSSKLRNRYIRPPRTTPDLLQTQDSQYSLDIHSTTQHNTTRLPNTT